MMRNMSFAVTTRQFRDRSKRQTRRLGWLFLKVGDILQGVEKCQGLKKGERVKKLGAIRVTELRREPLDAITQADVDLEGFPEMTPLDFVQMFCKVNGCLPDTMVTVITYEYLDRRGRRV